MEKWRKDEEAVFQGWDFSYLRGRMSTPRLPWDYKKLTKGLMSKSESVLDMETGGGEIFSSLAPFPKHAVAYEGYEPNIPIAKSRLGPLGVKVVRCDSVDRLPFKDGEFDLVLNRHGAIHGREISRIMKRGGMFLTQQVTGTNKIRDIVREFGAKRKFSHITLEEYRRQLEGAGFEILKAMSWKGKMVFKDVGAIVYYLNAIPWAVPGFSLKTRLPDLIRLQNRLRKKGRIEFETARFMILAKKPAA